MGSFRCWRRSAGHAQVALWRTIPRGPSDCRRVHGQGGPSTQHSSQLGTSHLWCLSPPQYAGCLFQLSLLRVRRVLSTSPDSHPVYSLFDKEFVAVASGFKARERLDKQVHFATLEYKNNEELFSKASVADPRNRTGCLISCPFLDPRCTNPLATVLASD